MKALTLTQPWATLVAIGAKRIETRSWGTDYRGQLAIHAAKGFPTWARDTCRAKPFERVLWHAGVRFWSDVPCGAVVATATLRDCHQIHATGDPGGLALFNLYGAEYEREFGDYGVGRFMWVITDVQPLAKPVPARGALGLWEWAEAGELAVIAP